MSAICELYPNQLDRVPPFYLDTISYDFLMQEFTDGNPKPYASKKSLLTFIKNLDNGISSVDEYGRNLLSACMLIYMRYKGDRRLASYSKKATKCALHLIDLGISLTQPDVQGKTPLDYVTESKNEEVLAVINQV